MRSRCVLSALVGAVLLSAHAESAWAQALEHFPPLSAHAHPRVLGTVAPRLAEVVITSAGREIALPDLPLPSYLGRPVSPELIAKIEADIKAQLDTSDRPVSVNWMRDGDLTAGVVRFDVTQTDTKAEPALATPKVKRPWDAYVGYKYFATRDLNIRRIYAGGSLRGPAGELAFQATVSPDRVAHAAHHPKFNESFTTYAFPIAERSQFEASLDLIELNFRLNPSVYRFNDVMASAGFRHTLLPGNRPGITRDLRFGIEAKNERLTLLTGGALVNEMASEVYQIYGGYHVAHQDGDATSDLDIVAHFSPGGLDSGNTSAQHRIYSDGRVSSARYAYVYLTYDRVTPVSNRFDWHSQAVAELATGALPFSEQPALGGTTLVRGYHFIDGSFDDILVIRNELVLKRRDGRAGPYIFWDMGSGRDKGLKTTDLLGSLGVGGQIEITAHAKLIVNLVHTLAAGQFTTRGTDEVGADLMIEF